MRALRNTCQNASRVRTFTRGLASSSFTTNPNLVSPALRRYPHNHIQSHTRATASAAIKNIIIARGEASATTASRLLSQFNALSHASRRSLRFSTRNLIYPSPAHATKPLESSMYARGVGVAVIGVLGYGAWSVYKENGTESFGIASTQSSSTITTPSAQTTLGADDASQKVRQVLVVSANELHRGTWVGEGPISKQTDGDGRRVIEMLTPEQATQQLRKHEQSFFVDRGQGVVRYDLVQLGSNDPIEDDHSERIVEMPNKILQEDKDGTTDWMFWGVFDGHSGWPTSAKLRQSLIRYVALEVNNTYKDTLATATGIKPTPGMIDSAIKRGFIRLDNEIVHESVDLSLKAKSKNKAAELLAPALSGSCALLSFYDPISQTLRVACTGDSRAVLGRKSSSGKWTAAPLSNDQTGSNPDEAARLRKEHPGEESKVVRNGRVLGGLEPTRAFGDAIYKWSKEVHNKLRQSFFVRSVSPDLATPPYVTAEPVVTTTRVEPQSGDFLVMATDGLWEMLSNEEVVGLVGKWIEAQHASGADLGKQGGSNPGVWTKLWGPGGLTTGLPVEDVKDSKDGTGQKAPIRQLQWNARPAEERFVVKDKNVATHLVRNALGGKNDEQVCALLTLPSPYSRRYRDDLTVSVIFFGNQPGASGMIEVNEEASAPVQPKL